MPDRQDSPVYRTPWLDRFVDAFLKDGAQRAALLVGPPGIGKTLAASVVVRHLLRTEPNARILVVAPKAIAPSWRASLEAGTPVPTTLVDRRRFREIQAHPKIGEFWSNGVTIMDPLTIARPEVRAFVQSTSWAMLVLDELNGMARTHLDSVSDLDDAGTFARVLGLARRQPEHGFFDKFETTDWTHHYAAGHGRNRKRALITYRRASEEADFLRDLDRFAESLGWDNLDRAFWRRVASSSLPVLENALLRVQVTLQKMAAINESLGSDFSDFFDRRLLAGIDDVAAQPKAVPEHTPRQRGAQTEIVHRLESNAQRLLDRLSELGEEAKLTALSQQLHPMLLRAPDCRVCVFTEFAGTAEYVATKLTECDLMVALISGSSTPDERAHSLDAFDRAGGVLVYTDAVGFSDLTNATHVFHFDLPETANRMELRRGNFDRVGRRTPVHEYAFLDEDNSSPEERQKLSDYGWSVNGQGATQSGANANERLTPEDGVDKGGEE